MSSHRSIRNRPKVPLALRKRTPQACIQCRSAKRRCSSYRGETCAGCLRKGQKCEFGKVETITTLRSPNEINKSEITPSPENAGVDGSHVERNNGTANQIVDASILDIASNAISEVDVARDTSPTSIPLYQNLPSIDFCGTSELEDFILKQVINRFPSMEIATTMLETFNQCCQSNYFYFDIEWLNKLIKNFYEPLPASEPRASCDTVCLMLVVFAVARQFEHLNEMQDSSLLDTMSDQMPGQELYRLAQIIMPRAIAIGSLASIQACLMGAIYLLPSDDRSTAYVYFGIALRMAIASGMHRTTNTEHYSPRHLEIRNRVFWTVYLNEREVSMFLGRPTSISIIDIDIPFPQFRSDIDDQNEVEKLQKNTALLHLIKICNRVSILTTREARASHFEKLQASLLEWSHEHAPEIPSSGTHCLRPAVHLRLFYNLAFIYLGQHELTDLVRRYVRNLQVESTLATTRASKEMSTACVNAAMRIVDLIECLRLRSQLALFSIVDIHSCSSALTVLILSSVTRPSPETSEKIEIALNCLRHVAAGSRSARNGLELIERFQRLVDRVITRLPAGKMPRADTNSSSECDYGESSSASEACFQSSPDSLFSKDPDGNLQAITDIHHPYSLQGSVPELPGSDIEAAPQTAFDFEFPGSDFLLSIEQYSYEDLKMFGFSGITSSMDCVV